ncbi:asparaginase, partial [Bacillus sp. S34]|nr:asparaginase [Bacillus sp. S34]
MVPTTRRAARGPRDAGRTGRVARATVAVRHVVAPRGGRVDLGTRRALLHGGAGVEDGAALDEVAVDLGFGRGASDTVTIERLRVLAKLGAEGVMVMGLPGGAAVAVKTLDGAQRAGTLAALTLLERNGLV